MPSEYLKHAQAGMLVLVIIIGEWIWKYLNEYQGHTQNRNAHSHDDYPDACHPGLPAAQYHRLARARAANLL